MNPIRILVADDDPGMRVLLTGIVQKVEGYDLVGTACSGEELLQLYDQQRPQVVIMDVEMPGKTGIECAEVIQDRDPSCILIFVTAHEKYMGDAFRVYAFDYLLKPFSVERAGQTLRLAAQRLNATASRPEPRETNAPAVSGNGARLMLRGRDGITFVSTADILLVQREERQTVIYATGGRRYITTDSLSDIDEKLCDDVFLRTHKSCIVNVNCIENITPYGRWTYVATLTGVPQDALITADKFEEIKQRFE